MQGAGQALVSAGGVASRIATDMQSEANALRVNDAMNQYMAAQTSARAEVLQLKGKNALERPDNKSLPDEFGERLDQVVSGIGEKLGNTAQRQAFTAAAQRQGIQFRSAVTEHMVQQSGVYRKETQKATLETAVNQGTLLWGDASALAQAKGTIERVVADIAKDHGMSPEARDMALVDAMTPLHMGVMKSMITGGQANAARAYYDENSAGMSLQARSQMQGVVKQASDVQTGDAAADAAWSISGPQGVNDAVKLFDLEKAVRAQLKDNPDAMKQAIDGLRQRAQAFNSQQAETNAAGINSVFALIDGGKPMSVVMRSDAWMSLPALKQHEIAKSMENEAHARESRALTAENRALAAESRQAMAGQKQERALLFQNGDAYLRYSDPEVLKDMTRQQVEATRTVFGMEGSQHLLQRFDALQRPGAIGEARIDKQDFDEVADRMGLNPFNAKTPAEKKQLGTLHFRVEQLINTAQQTKKGTLTRDEKMALMTGELARSVRINNRFMPDETLPVIGLNADQAGKVIVPLADTKQIREALAVGRASQPNNPAYFDTPGNVQRMYLRSKSRAADLIREAK